MFASTQLGAFSGFGFSSDTFTMADQVWVQFVGVMATVVYTAIVTWVLLKLVGLFGSLRVSVDEETQGLDIVLHEERGYDI